MTITIISMTASISLAFVASKTEAIYYLIVATFRELIIGDVYIKVLLTDDEDALKNTLSSIYPDTPQLLYL
jgi:hypothetical protein